MRRLNTIIYIKPKLLKLPQFSTTAQYFKKKTKTKKKHNNKHDTQTIKPKIHDALPLDLFLISLTLPSPSPKTQNSDNLSSHISQMLSTASPKTQIWSSPSSTSSTNSKESHDTHHISFLRPPTSNLYNPETTPHLPWVSSKPTMPTIPTNPALSSGNPFAINHPHATSTTQKRHPICLGLIQPMAHQLCRSVIHPIQPVKTGPKVTTKQI